MVDQIRFYAGAARLLEGRSAGEYMTGFTSFVRREPIGVCAQVTPWNYPMMMAVWKFAPAIAAGNTVVLKPAPTTPVSTLLLAEIVAGVRAPGRVQRGVRRPRDGPGAGVAPRAPDGVDHRERAGRARGGHRRGPGHQARAPRARGQGAGRGLRRRRCREGGRGHRHRRLLQRRSGLHGGDPGAGRTRRPRRPRIGASSNRPRARPWPGPDVEGADFGPLNNTDQLARVRGFIDDAARPTPRCAPVAIRSATGATSTSPPW